MASKKALIISICTFIIVGMCALLLILNKAYWRNWTSKIRKYFCSGKSRNDYA